ncbi:MAG: alpha/beta hydrolase, partial [Deltaproteobacteria bacterium CG_4_8_14_3_um_filter_51_11]
MRNAVKERSLFLESGEIRLEALFAELQGARGAVITHPHPLYGGDMHNSVVEAAVSAYRESGISTLRFNFQGVGRSGGAFDQGLGERANVLSAVKSMSDSGRDKIDLVGYS